MRSGQSTINLVSYLELHDFPRNYPATPSAFRYRVGGEGPGAMAIGLGRGVGGRRQSPFLLLSPNLPLEFFFIRIKKKKKKKRDRVANDGTGSLADVPFDGLHPLIGWILEG